MDDQSDSDLVHRARQGDPGAFEVLLVRHLPVLRTLTSKVLNDPALVDDAVQETTLQAWLHLDQLRQPGRFGPWCLSIGINVSRLMLRMRAHEGWPWDALLGGMYVPDIIDPRPQPAEYAEIMALQDRVRQAVAALPPGQRAAVLLFYLQGLGYAETAAILKVDVGAVKTRLHKARARLRSTLWPVWKDELMEPSDVGVWVDMQVADVCRMPPDGRLAQQIMVVLADVTGERRLPIFIGRREGELLAMTIERVELPRPLTYTLTVQLLEATGNRIREVRIHRLVDNVFYAEVCVSGPMGTHCVDARPSDALNLAALVNVPIHVAEAVLAQSTVPGNGDWDALVRDAQARGQPLDNLPSREDFEQIRIRVSGQQSGGAAAIVAELQR